MFCLYTQTPEFFNDICDEIRLFVPVKRIEREESADASCEKVLRHFFSVAGDVWVSKAEYAVGGEVVAACEKSAPARTETALLEKKHKKRLVKQTVYELLKNCTGKTPPWGSLTGIRPTTMTREYLRGPGGEKNAIAAFRAGFDVSEPKAGLAFDIVRNQLPFMDAAENDVDIYIGIPFCTSRCKYCSFVSRDVARAGGRKAEYLERLFFEMRAAKPLFQKWRARCVYVGGGTPTALSAEELDALLSVAGEVFGKPMEYTVEAGRPDTVTAEKLAVIKSRGAGRVSINPQTTKQATLDLIGRKHSVQDFFDAYALAREMGFDEINADLILGLPGEDMDDVRRTLGQVAELEPENITVHTLAIKNASEFAREQGGYFSEAGRVERMVGFAQEFMRGEGYEPYYLYRQKYMSGNLENVGFMKPGHACRYNIDIMEETVSNMAFGAGGISKRVFGAEKRIERAANVKDVEHYIARTREMAERKAALFGSKE